MLGGGAVLSFQENIYVELEPHGLRLPEKVIKRDGRSISFEAGKILTAVQKCLVQVESAVSAETVCQQALRAIAARFGTTTPSVEDIQDCVVMAMFGVGEFEGARQYIDYRSQRAEQRQIEIPEDVKAAFALDATYFPTSAQRFMFYDKYSRYSEEKGRRETWPETVDRVMAFLTDLSEHKLDPSVYRRLHDGILRMEVMPSMRTLATAGPAAERNHIATYNCAYLPIRDIQAFVECLLISMAGAGVGYSVEREHVENFPRVKRQKAGVVPVHVVEDTTEGWGEAVRLGFTSWWSGKDVTFDFSQIRPAGSILRVKGGRASGPGPLRELLAFARTLILGRQGSYLRSVDIHDLVCKIGDAVVAGGVRRCLPGGTRVHTRRGSIPIEEVVVGDDVMTARGYKPVTGAVVQGKQRLVELLTESGTVFKCTPDHRIAVLSDVWGNYTFKQAQHILPTDRILFITHPIDGEVSPLLPLPEKREADHSGSTVVQPTLTEETAWFLGKFFADGYVSLTEAVNGKGGNTTCELAFHESETAQIERALAWYESHGIPVKSASAKGQHCVKIRTGNRQIARWMYQYKQPNVPLIIPEFIWRAPQEHRASFVAGLMDGDGTYGDRPISVVSTVYESFARDVVRLLASLGIIAELRIRRPARGVWKAVWVVSVKDAWAFEKAKTVVGDKACGTWIPRVKKQSGYKIPGAFVKRDLSRKDWGLKWTGKGDMNSATLTEIVDSRHYVPVKVLEVRGGKEEETFDLEVKDGSTFVAEGYLVHNTALIALFDPDDLDMFNCKSGIALDNNPHRWNSNNSAVWSDNTSDLDIIEQMVSMARGRRGEPGIVSRAAAIATKPARRKSALFGVNPCSEIFLRPYQFCNLSICVARKGDTESTLRRKVELATILGTIQSMATNFPGLRPEWKANCEEERLLGVDITGQADCEILAHTTQEGADLRDRLRQHAIAINQDYAYLLGIPASAAITCDKPSGNSSELLDCASGIHRRMFSYYVRNMRVSATSPLFRVLKDAGVPMDPENGQNASNATTWVIHFPKKSPEGALLRTNYSAVEQCEFWLLNKRHWTEHNPSATIYYKANELADLISWVVKNKDILGGLSFLPASDAQYDQMPYEEIDEATYEQLSAAFPEVDYSKLYVYEQRDMTTSSKELACSSGACELF